LFCYHDDATCDATAIILGTTVVGECWAHNSPVTVAVLRGFIIVAEARISAIVGGAVAFNARLPIRTPANRQHEGQLPVASEPSSAEWCVAGQLQTSEEPQWFPVYRNSSFDHRSYDRLASAKRNTGNKDTASATLHKEGEWRASKLAGVDVYNEANEKIGDINDVILDKSARRRSHSRCRLAFGMGEHYVEVPFEKIKWSMHRCVLQRLNPQ